MYGFIDVNKGKSIDVRMVKTMIIVIVAMMGPIEFSAKIESRNDNAATVVIAIAANPKQQ